MSESKQVSGRPAELPANAGERVARNVGTLATVGEVLDSKPSR